MYYDKYKEIFATNFFDPDRKRMDLSKSDLSQIDFFVKKHNPNFKLTLSFSSDLARVDYLSIIEDGMMQLKFTIIKLPDDYFRAGVWRVKYPGGLPISIKIFDIDGWDGLEEFIKDIYTLY